MAIHRMDHASVVVDDLQAAIAFFTELGMEQEGGQTISGPWLDRVNGLDGVEVETVMMRTPDGQGKLDLTKFHSPAVIHSKPDPPNTFGLKSLMFAVDDVKDTVNRLRAHGGELVGEIAQYEDLYLVCYLRGPGGMIIALAEQLN